ncbi:ABC transporter permease subunit [Bradyrhizobium sp. ISRA464]|uniref:molybdate ABC transporter permease subunit n=2 Tax=unclassified Bradyrhizobium TaxID=2631580 RepID=UPI00247A78D4|nr:ABC transporter permease subunit [Bradyrhizobium sp. ISRA464]WGS30564.1 ABC transporter permease subunit [Bradyrhizobium sp. ISRA464]
MTNVLPSEHTLGTGRDTWRPVRPIAAMVGVLALCFLIAPFVTLIFVTDWRGFQIASGDWSAAGTSLLYSFVSMPILISLGTPLAWWLARSEFPGKWVVDGLLLLPLLTPPLAMGMLLMSLYGPYSRVGSSLEAFGVVLTNSAAAFTLAQVYAATPYYVVSARAAFEAVPRDLEQVALTLGKEPWQVFLEVTLPLSLLGLVAGLALAWVRALGEFGIVLIVAYYPQGIPVKLWVNLQDIGLSAVYPLLWLFFAVAMPLPLWLGLLSRRRGIF